MITLDKFITQSRNIFRNRSWVTEPKFSHLYVRYGQRYLLGNILDNVLDLATVEVEKEHRRTGVFTGLVARLRDVYPDMHLYVENASEEFCPLLLRLGFTEVPVSSFFLQAMPDHKSLDK